MTSLPPDVETDLREENARLRGELRTARDRQAASAEILHVISQSPTDVQPVFDAIVVAAARLLNRDMAFVLRRQGATFSLVAAAGPEGALPNRDPIPVPIDPDANFPSRVFLARKTLHLPDWSAIELPEHERRVRETNGINSALYLPLLREGECIGLLGIAGKLAGIFADSEIALAESFRDQALIAIENTRLFNETRGALERQTATSDILKVIASSPSDVQPVFEAIVNGAAKLFEPCSATITTLKDGKLHWNATASLLPNFNVERAKAVYPIPFEPDRSPSARAILERRIIEIPDIAAPNTPEITRQAAAAGGFRSATFVPLVTQDHGIGSIILTQPQAGFRLSEKQLALVQTFADQAVIAIENARLFDEVQARTRDLQEALTHQTGSSNILKVIAASPTDVGPVLKAIVENACELCEAYDAAVVLKDGDDLRFSAHHGPIPIGGLEKWPINRNWTLGRAFVDKMPVHVHDLLDSPDFPDGREMARRMGHRSILSVPLLRENESIGAIALRRTEVQPFSDKQIALLQTFADQAVIAIGNVRLFDEVQARTRELSQSLDDLRTAQDRLGQLTAGIAHEIKNPLNFVNNFAALSAGLTDELNDTLKPVPLVGTTRDEVDELTRMLKDNLEKVVQHGKRADSIVKNMLLHSREGTGEHRPADINALLDESLNLAYHGARAEKPQFNVTLRRDFDENAGTIEVFPQEITRVFLNLISNGFYAVTKRKMEVGNSGFEPTLSATTRNLGHAVEIRIRDNGTGIPAEVKEKMFNPFYTTKPAGEGTGLGLSMSHDIVVKQHGGTIEVDTELGQYTEFRIVLPRAGHQSSQKRGQT